MNPDLLIAYTLVIGGLWLVIYAGRKRLAIGQTAAPSIAKLDSLQVLTKGFNVTPKAGSAVQSDRGTRKG